MFREHSADSGVHAQMQALALIRTNPSPEKSFAPLIAGIAAAAAMARILVPHHRFQSLSQLLLLAAVQTALTVAASILGVRIAGYLLSRKTSGVSSFSVAIAAWIAPLVVCLSYGSVLAIPLAAVIAAGTTSYIRRAYEIPEDGSGGMRKAGDIVHLLRIRPLSELILLALAALLLHAAVAAGASKDVPTGVALACIASVMIVWQTAKYRAVHAAARSIRNVFSSWLVLALAFMITVGAIRSANGGSGDAPAHAGKDGDTGGHFRGIFLFPDVVSEKPVTQFAPLLTMPASLKSASREPIKIRFDGVYWFFQSPDRRPPVGATILQGVPDKIGFHSTNARPIWMEAHQSLASPIDLAACSTIEVEVRNADALPGAVTLELILRDSSKPLPPVSLGSMLIPERTSIEQSTRESTLSFPVPLNPPIPGFDQLTFRFLPIASRWKVSPSVSIVSITLIPR